MLEICLFVLKILGIVVLCFLGLLLFALFLVLFAPIKYKSQGGKNADELKIQALISYLNPIVRIMINYPDKTIIKVSVLGITVFPRKSKEKIGDNQKKEKSTKQTVSTAEPHLEKKQKQVKAKSRKKDNFEYYVSLFTENKELILDVLHIVLKAFKTILPRKCKIRAVVGTGRADITGYIYAVYCSLKNAIPGEVYFEPVWTEAYAEGEYYFKGKTRVIHFLIALIKVFANKQVRILIKKFRRV